MRLVTRSFSIGCLVLLVACGSSDHPPPLASSVPSSGSGGATGRPRDGGRGDSGTGGAGAGDSGIGDSGTGDSGTGGTGAGGTGTGGAGTGGSTGTPGLVFEEWVGRGVWTNLRRTIAASTDGKVYVTDSVNVYRVIDGNAELFLTRTDLGIAGTTDEAYAVAVDPGGNVHVLTGPFTTEDRVFDTNGAPIGTIDFEAFVFPRYIAAASANEVYVVARDGMVKGDAQGAAVLYDDTALGGLTISCASEAVTVGHGRLYYLPGCNGTPQYSGSVDGSSFGLFLEDLEIAAALDLRSEFNGFFGFQGIAAHPTEGVITNMSGAIVHIHDDGTWNVIPTTPEIWTVGSASSPFHSAPVAIDGSNVYLLADSTIWIARGAF